MNHTPLNQLVQRLDSSARSALEQAIHVCASEHQAEVQPEHWLVQLLAQNPTLADALHQLGIEVSHWQQQLDSYLNQLPHTHQGVPKLSPWLVQLLQDGIFLAASECNQTVITPALVMYAFIKALQEQIWPTLRYHSVLAKLDLPAAKQQLLQQPLQKNNAAHPDEVLSRFTANLTALAQQGKLDAVIGRDQEIRQMVDVLTRRRQNNPILVGEAGVGKTALVEGLALRIVQGDVPPVLKDVQLLSLDLAALQAGAGVQGEFEQRLKDLVNAIQQSQQPIILFIDEVHNLIGAGGKQGHGDAANLLKPLLARGELRTIAATTWVEYKKYIENDAALTRRFETVRVLEPNEEQAIAMLQGLSLKLEQHHQVVISPDAIAAAVTLSRRYLPNRQLPDKAVSLLDTACARVQLSQHITPAAIETCQQRIQQLQAQIRQLQRSQQLGEIDAAPITALETSLLAQQNGLQQLQQRWQQEQQMIGELQQCRAQLLAADTAVELKTVTRARYQALLQQLKQAGEANMMALQVDTAMIAKVVADWTGIPMGQLLRSELQTTLRLEEELSQQILGQPYAIQLLARKLQTARVNLHDPHKPQGVFLLAGNSGIGKTETASAVAQLLYGGRHQLTVINMSEFKEIHKVSMLTGAPAGYVGYGEGGVLTEAIRRRPYGVILLDEMEKAHPNVQDIFFQVFDKGILMDGQGREIDCRHTVFLMTSNAGSQALANANPDSNAWQEPLEEELLHHFKPAFLARLTLLPYFNLSREILQGISQLKLQRIRDRLQQQQQITLHYSSQLLDQLADAAQASISNARHIDHLIETQLLPKISSEVIAQLLAEQSQSASFKLDYQAEQGYTLTV